MRRLILVLGLVVAAVVGTVPPPAGAVARLGSAGLAPGAELGPDAVEPSPSGAYRLVMQGDGNLVLYDLGGIALWSSGTQGHPGARATMQADGNLVVQRDAEVLWHAGTWGHPGAGLQVQDDGNVVVSVSGRVLWTTWTTGRGLYPGQALAAGTGLRSPGGGYWLLLGADGDLRVVGPPGRTRWSTGTAGHPGAVLTLQLDGNLVLSDPTGVLWHAGTWGHPGARLQVQDDGNVVLYQGGAALWDARTYLPLSGLLVVVDPGHNGANFSHPAEIGRPVDAGGFLKACNTTGTAEGALTESAVNFSIGQSVAARLRALGATVLVTRAGDDGWGPCIDDRGLLANRTHAALLLSVHADGAAAGRRGFHVISPGAVPGYTDGVVGPSATAARRVRDALVAGGFSPSNYVGTDGLVTRTDLGTLNRAGVPAVMVEVGNMHDPVDLATMAVAAGRDRIAAALVQGVTRYLAS